MEDRTIIENKKKVLEKLNNYEEKTRSFFRSILDITLVIFFWIVIILGIYYSLKAFLGW